MLMHPDTAAALDSFTKGYRLGVAKADEDAAKQGAERERRRIRRVQADAMRDLSRLKLTLVDNDLPWDRSLAVIIHCLDAATKAPKKGRK
jgi:hypothetical protein